VPANKNRNKKKNTQSVKKDLEMILEMNSNVIIHRLLNSEGDIDLFIPNGYGFMDSENIINKKNKKLKNKNN
jgi:hypothetical protein